MNMLVLYTFIISMVASLVLSQDVKGVNLSPPFSCTTTTTTSLCKPENMAGMASSQGIASTRVQQGRPEKIGPVGQKGQRGQKGDPCQCNIVDEEEVTHLRSELSKLHMQFDKLNENDRQYQLQFDELKENNSQLQLQFDELKGNNSQLQQNLKRLLPADCSEYRLARRVTAEKATFDIMLYGEIASVNCIFDESNAWTVIQRRMDGSVDFYRGWEDYKNGFGNPDGELWLGLDKLHKMTSGKSYSLRIDLLNWEGERRYAAYSTFRIGDEDSNYRLTVSGYSGNAKDGMNYHNAKLFTTHDRDNDQRGTSTMSGNCAVDYHGAWWYKGCYRANLNGKYYKSLSGPGNNGISWSFWNGFSYSLKYVEMKITPN
ncbi:tenascin-R-like [Styela clava]